MDRSGLSKVLVLVAAFVAATVIKGSATGLTAEDYCDPILTKPAAIRDAVPMHDGETFCSISKDGRSIERLSYKTGKAIEKIFDLSDLKGDLKIRGFEGFELSANEKKILLWNASRKIYRNSFEADYYVYDIFRKTLKAVAPGKKQRCASLSHDGRLLAYVYANNIYIANLEYGSEVQVTTDGETGKIINGAPDWVYEEELGMLNGMRWSRDDSILAYIRFDESEVPVYGFDEYPSYSEESPLGNMYPPRFVYKYPLAGDANSSVEIYAYEVDNRRAKKMDLDLKGLYVPSMEFDGNGAMLMVMSLNREQNHLTLFKVNPKSTVAAQLIEEKSNAWLSPGAYQMIRYYPESFVIGSERNGWRHLYEYSYTGALKKQLTSGEWNVTDYYGKDDRGVHYFQSTQLGPTNRVVARTGAKGAEILNKQEGTAAAAFSSSFRYFLRTYSNAQTPPQYSVCSSSGALLNMIEDNADYARKYSYAPKMEFLLIDNGTGEQMEAFIIKPVDFDSSKKYPAVMYQYNGPDSQLVLNRWKMDGTYYLASQGYIVMAVDGRGTGNRSRQWAQCVYRNLGDLEVSDQLAGAKWLGSQPYVDEKSMACFGWSFGGYMTLMELSSDQNPFKAGVAMAAVTDWHFYDSIYTERYMSIPSSNERGYDSSSALLKSGNLGGRLLIMSGSNDDNVHFYNTLLYTSKLSSEEKLFDMMVFSGYEHSLRTGNARTMLYRKTVDFLDKELK